MRVAVTGGGGFIGSYVVDSLVGDHEVHVFDRKHTWKNAKASYHLMDMTKEYEVNEVFNSVKPDVCIHMAGILGTSETWNYPTDTINVNIIGSNHVYNACGVNKCNIITVDVGSRWLSPYTITKTCSAEFAQAYAQKYNIKCGILRIFNVYGPRQSTKIIKIVPAFINRSVRNETLEVWGDKNTDLVHAADVGRAFALAVDNIDKIDKRTDIFIGSGKVVKTSELASMIVEKIGSGNISHSSPRLGEEARDAGYMDSTAAKELLGWEPLIPISEGLDSTIQFYKDKDIAANYGKF
jgi:nucleoside-diphosphate-sugar epimerase